MKKILFIFCAIALIGCSSIPNKSVFEDLTTKELAKAIKADPEFGEFYEGMHALINLSSFSEVQKAQFKDVTYRRLYKYSSHLGDSAYWTPKEQAWAEDWNNSLAHDLEKVDEKMQYWSDYKAQNSLNRFADVKLSDFYITHYSYIGGVDDAYICFTISPKDGELEQIKFTYSYSYKIDGGKGKKTNKCIYSKPISKPYEAMWEIEYFEKSKFDGMTVSKFNSMYDLNIEITDVRKDGVNYSLDDLNIPEAIINLWNEDTEENRDEVAKLVNPAYVNQSQYLSIQKDENMKKHDELCHSFMNAMQEASIGSMLKSLFD